MSAAPEPPAVAVAAQHRPIREIVAYFLRLGTLRFGGPVDGLAFTASITGTKR